MNILSRTNAHPDSPNRARSPQQERGPAPPDATPAPAERREPVAQGLARRSPSPTAASEVMARSIFVRRPVLPTQATPSRKRPFSTYLQGQPAPAALDAGTAGLRTPAPTGFQLAQWGMFGAASSDAEPFLEHGVVGLPRVEENVPDASALAEEQPARRFKYGDRERFEESKALGRKLIEQLQMNVSLELKPFVEFVSLAKNAISDNDLQEFATTCRELIDLLVKGPDPILRTKVLDLIVEEYRCVPRSIAKMELRREARANERTSVYRDLHLYGDERAVPMAVRERLDVSPGTSWIVCEPIPPSRYAPTHARSDSANPGKAAARIDADGRGRSTLPSRWQDAARSPEPDSDSDGATPQSPQGGEYPPSPPSAPERSPELRSHFDDATPQSPQGGEGPSSPRRADAAS
ncbi:MAG: hypothetical protein EOO24_01185 [Comamonadaceae bacterium]|nr:MAG: hypothetical protein EOO24_01185 [Comamonadaceae bacterium]